MSSDETNHGEVSLVISAEPLSSLLFGLTSNFSDHDDTLSFGVDNKLAQNIDEVCSIEGVSSNAYNGGLTKSIVRSLVDSFIGECSRSRYNTNFTPLVDVTWHDTNLTLARLDDTGAVRSNESRLVLGIHD